MECTLRLSDHFLYGRSEVDHTHTLPPPWIENFVCLAMANGHDKKLWKACGEAAVGGRRRRAVGGGSGGSDRIGNDLAKIDFLLKKYVLGQFVVNFGHFWTF